MSDEIGPADGLSLHDASAPREDARRAVRLAPGQRRAAGVASSARAASPPRSSRSARPPASPFSSPSARSRTRSSRRGRPRSRTSRGGCRTACSSAALGSEFDMPSVYITGPEGIVATSTDAHHPARRRHDDRLGRAVHELRHRRQTRRLRAEAGRDRAARRASRTRSTRRSPSATSLKQAIKPGVRADETMKAMDAALSAAGYGVIEFNRPNADDKTDVVYGFHPVGNTGHDIGPSLTTWQPLQTHVHAAPAAPVLVRVLRLHADSRMGRQEAADPDRGRRDPDGARRSSSCTRPTTGCS